MTSPLFCVWNRNYENVENCENGCSALARPALDTPIHFPRHRHRKYKKIPQPVLGWGLYLSRHSSSVVSYALI